MPQICILAGDGIGPEIMEEAKKVLACFKPGLDYALVEKSIGGAAIDATGSPFPKESEQAALSSDAVLLGAVGGPKWDHLSLEQRPEKGLLNIRTALGLFANLRPLDLWPALADFSPLKPALLTNVSFVIVRELMGDLYFGEPRGYREVDGVKSAFNTMIYSEPEIRRIAKTAFDIARRRKRKVCSIDKSNVLETMKFWREIIEDEQHNFPDVALSHLHVDNAAMQIVSKPSLFDVILAPNMFGDILSDEAAVLAGSLGLLPSASLGERHALYEPIHGSAPDIAGQGIANPIGTILSVGMMLNHSFGKPEWEVQIKQAVGQVLASGLRTADIWSEGMRKVSTQEMGSAIAKELSARLG